MITAEQAEALMREFYRCQNEGDWDALEHCVTEDIYFYDMGYRLELKGRKALTDSCIAARDGVFSERTFGFERIWDVTPRGFVVCKNWSGILRKDALGSAGGTTITMRAATLITVRDGLISEYLDYACYAWPALGLSDAAQDLFVHKA